MMWYSWRGTLFPCFSLGNKGYELNIWYCKYYIFHRKDCTLTCLSLRIMVPSTCLSSRTIKRKEAVLNRHVNTSHTFSLHQYREGEKKTQLSASLWKGLDFTSTIQTFMLLSKDLASNFCTGISLTPPWVFRSFLEQAPEQLPWLFSLGLLKWLNQVSNLYLEWIGQ